MKTNTSTRLRWALALCAFASTLVGSSLPAQSASNGGYQEIRVLEGPGGQKIEITEPPRTARQKFFSLLASGKFDNAEDQKLFDDYFRFWMAELTWKEKLPLLTAKRDELRKQFMSRATPDLHNRLNDRLLKEMPKIALDDSFHPAVRANCMLILADLNQQEPRPGGEGAVPLPSALPVLVDAVQDTDQHDVVRVMALRGIVRHAESNMAADLRKPVVQAMLLLIKSKEPPEGSKDGHLWMCMMAADVLGTLAAQGAAEANVLEVSEALAGMAANGEIWVRCQAAESLGALDAKSFAANGVGRIATDLANLVVDISKGNAATAAEVDTAAAPPKLREIVAAELVDQLTRVKSALVGAAESPAATRGLRAAAEDELTRQFIAELIKKIDELMAISVDSKLSLTDLAKSVQDKGRELETWLKTQTGKAAAEPVAVGASVRPKPETTPVNLNR